LGHAVPAFARYAAHLTPEVDVRIPRPGKKTVFLPPEGWEEAAPK